VAAASAQAVAKLALDRRLAFTLRERRLSQSSGYCPCPDDAEQELRALPKEAAA